MQAIFHVPNVQQKILRFDISSMDGPLKKVEQSAETDAIEKKKIRFSVKLILALQRLFSNMLLSKVSYQDPTEVLEAIVDDNGEEISIYEQKDIGEFFLNFLERLQDGLGENKNLIKKAYKLDFKSQVNEGLSEKEQKEYED